MCENELQYLHAESLELLIYSNQINWGVGVYTINADHTTPREHQEYKAKKTIRSKLGKDPTKRPNEKTLLSLFKNKWILSSTFFINNYTNYYLNTLNNNYSI